MSATLSPAERRRKARQMRRRTPTPSIREIADELGVSVGTAHRDVNPEAAERYAEQARKYKQQAPRRAAGSEVEQR
jgi:transposase